MDLDNILELNNQTQPLDEIQGFTSKEELKNARLTDSDINEESKLVELSDFFIQCGKLKDKGSNSQEVLNTIDEMFKYINKHIVKCDKEKMLKIFELYIVDPRFIKTIDAITYKGGSHFLYEAIKNYCS